MATAFYDPSAVTQQLVDAVKRALERPGTRAAALAAVRGMDYAAVEHRYGHIDKPVLLLWGRDDAVAPLEYAERLAAQLPDARLARLPRCGHFPMIEARNASNRALARFLDATSEAGQ